jgi:hypothetical protein
MSSPIDPIRKSNAVRRARQARADGTEGAHEAEDRSVPALYEPAPPPALERQGESAAAFNAHLLGQEGQKRGLRGGPETLGAARTVYNRTEWSGPADRRARKGGAAKTEI